jgi:hypothetical protein
VLPSIRKTGEYRVKRPYSKREGMRVEIVEMLWTIDSCLEHGDKKRVAMEIGVSEVAINKVINGVHRSPRILNALYKKALSNNNLYLHPEKVIKKLRGI